jgi:hypothetical protein
MEYVGVSVIVRSQLKGVKPKMRRHKFRNGVFWHGYLQQKGVKKVGRKTRAMCTRNNKSNPLAGIA